MIDKDKVVELSRKLVLNVTVFSSCWEIDTYGPKSIDGEEIHKEILEALGISREEYLAQL